MKRSAILSLMFIAGMLAVPGVLNAQVEKRVEVSKAYVPSVEHATKLAVRPNMVDTAAIQPEIDYSSRRSRSKRSSPRARSVLRRSPIGSSTVRCLFT